jgi:hypothetical protein
LRREGRERKNTEIPLFLWPGLMWMPGHQLKRACPEPAEGRSKSFGRFFHDLDVTENQEAAYSRDLRLAGGLENNLRADPCRVAHGNAYERKRHIR